MHMPLQIMLLMLEALRHAHALRKLRWARGENQCHCKPIRKKTSLLNLPEASTCDKFLELHWETNQSSLD